jgi:hypothetical protein
MRWWYPEISPMTPKGLVQPKPNCLILVSIGGVSMGQAMSGLMAPDLMAPCLSGLSPCYNKAEVRAALHQGTFNRADPDFVWTALPGVRMERWIIDTQDREAPRVRHRRLP